MKPDRQPIDIDNDGINDDVSDDSTLGINYSAPNRFIYETLIRPVLFDPTYLADTGIVASIQVDPDEQKFIRSDIDNYNDDIFKNFVVGQKITASGFDNNNGVYTIEEVTDEYIKVKESLSQEDNSSLGDERLVVKVPFTQKTLLTVNLTDNSFNRQEGSFREDGIIAGMRFSASGFNQNNGEYTVKEVSEDGKKIVVVENLQSGDEIGSGNEQLIVQGKRGFAIDEIFLPLRELLSQQVEGKDTVDFNFLAADLIDKFIQGETPTEQELDDLYIGYLQTWINSIDQGLRHWSEFGLAFTRAFYDPQSRRDLQNKERGKKLGEDNLIGIEKENSVGIFDVLIEELDDPDGDGSTSDSFINKYLLPMFGIPRELALIRTVMQTVGTALDEFVIQPLELVINPLLVGIETLEQFVSDFIKKQIEEVFGIDFELFDFLTQTNSKMDLASIEIDIAGIDVEIPIFKSGDRELLNQYLGIVGDDEQIHNPAPNDIIEDLEVSVAGVTINFHENPTGALKDDISFNKEAFSAYDNAVTLSKLLLLQENPIDGEATGSNQLSQLFSDILTAQNNGNPVTYDASLLNLNGNHGGNILTMTLPGIADSEPWLISIDNDHSWRQDSLTTTKTLFKVNTSNNGQEFAVWEADLTPSTYTIQTTWLLNVTQLIDNLDNSDNLVLPDQNIIPATDAKYKIYDGSNLIATISKNQSVFEADSEDEGLSFANLGTFNISSGNLRIELENFADGNVVAGPVRVVSQLDSSVQIIQLTRDPETLVEDPNDGYSEIGTNWIDIKYDTGTGNFPLWESEILRPVYRELFTDWQNDGLQFPALGDETSSDPNSDTNLTANPLPSHANEFGPNIPDTPIIIPIPESLKNLILNGLDDLVDFADDLDDLSPFTVTLPIIDQTLAEIINLPDQIHQRLRSPIQDYFNNDPTPTIGELFDVIENQFGGSTNNLEPIIEFNLDLQKIITQTITLSLADQGLGITFGADAILDVITNFGFVSADDETIPKFTVGFDLSENIDADERVYIKADKGIFKVDIDADNLNFGVTLGTLQAGIVGGEINIMDAGIDLKFNDPNAPDNTNDPNYDGRITLKEITGTSIDTLLTATTTGSLTGHLPVLIKNTEENFNLELGYISLTATDLFNPQTFTVNLVNNVNQDLLNQAIGVVLDLLESKVVERLGNKVPLLGSLSSDILQFIRDIKNGVNIRLSNLLDSTTEVLRMELFDLFHNELNILLDGNDEGTDISLNDLILELKDGGYLFAVKLGDQQSFNLPLDTSFGTSQLGLDINGNANVDLTYALDLGFGIDLDTNQNPQFYLDTSSDSELELELVATVPNLNANTRLFDLITLNVNDNGSQLDGTFTLDISDDDEKWRVGDNLDVDGTLSGNANLKLQGGINGSNDLAVDLAYQFPTTNLSDINLNLPTTTAITYKRTNFNSLADFADNFDTRELLSLGIDAVLNLIKDKLVSRLGDKVPLLGDLSGDILDFIRDIKNGVNTRLANLSESTTEAIRQELFELFTNNNPLTDINEDGIINQEDLSSGTFFTLLDTNNDGIVNLQDVELTLNSNGYFLKAKLGGIYSKTQSLDSSFGTSQLGLDITGNANVDLTYGFDLGFGIDLDTNQNPQFYLDTSSPAELELGLNVELDSNFDIDLFDKISLKLDAIGALRKSNLEEGSFATFLLDFKDDPDDQDNRLFSDEYENKFSIDGTLDAGANLQLNGEFLGQPILTANIGWLYQDDPNTPDQENALTNINLGEFDDFSLTFQGNDKYNSFEELANNFDFDAKELIKDAFCYILDELAYDLSTSLINQFNSIPILGDLSEDVLNFIQELKDGVNGKLLGLSSATTSAIQQALFELLTEGNNTLFTLQDTDGNGNINQQDIILELNIDGYFLAAKLGGNFETSTTFESDLGLDSLGLNLDAGANIGIGYDLNLALGIEQTDSGHQFYIDTDYFDQPDAEDPESLIVNEFEITLESEIDLQGRGDLGVIQLDIEDIDDIETEPEVTVVLGIDIQDQDNKLTIGETPTFDPTFDADVDLSLGLRTSFDGSEILPSLVSEFNLDWDIDSGEAPTVSFVNNGIDIGSFFTNFAEPIVKNIQEITKPLEPIAKFLTRPINIFDEVKGISIGEFSILELIAEFYDIDFELIKRIQDFVKFVNFVNSFPSEINDNLIIDLGDLVLSGEDPRASDFSLQSLQVDDFISRNSLSLQEQIDSNLDNQNTLTILENSQETNSIWENISSFFEQAREYNLEFPIIETPSTAFGLLFGQDVQLFNYTMPRLDINNTFDINLPIKGYSFQSPYGFFFALELGLEFFIHAQSDIVFGYDTYGLLGKGQFIDSNNVSDIFNGFYIETDKNNPLIQFGAGFTGSVAVEAGIGLDNIFEIVALSAGIEPQIEGLISLYLSDPNNDGLVRKDEMLALFSSHPLDFFNLLGEVYFNLNAFIELEFFETAISDGITAWEATFPILRERLLSFNVDFRGETQQDPQHPFLATNLGFENFSQDGILRLNIGPYADFRDDNKGDIAEVYVIKHDDEHDFSAENETLLVSSFGFVQDYKSINKIIGDAGEGDDIITLADESVLVPAELSGGVGNDSITGGNNDDTLSGNDGDDTLLGFQGNDSLLGNADGDFLNGGEGDDLLSGDEGNDTLIGENGDDTLLGGLDNDSLNGNEGDDSLSGDEDDDTLIGENGNDSLLGGLGNDYLIGGDGDDSLVGNEGDDTITGDNGVDYILGDDGNDNISGGFDNDTIFGGNDNDTIFGDNLNDLLYGESGNDWVDGGLGDDILEGGDGNDSLIGGYGRDLLVGEEGDDVLIGSDARDTLIGGNGADQFTYTEKRDSGDIIADFEVGVDSISFTKMFAKFDLTFNNYQDVIDQGYISFGQRGDTAIILFDQDGDIGPRRARPFLFVENLQVNSLNQAAHFLV